MIPAIRRQKLLDLLKEHDLLFLPDIIQAMDSSESTVRRDLKSLADTGEIELLRGGGVQLPKHNTETVIHVKPQTNKSEMEHIARTAVTFIHPGDIVFLDPSSTNSLLIDFISAENVTIITNSVTHMNKLLAKDIPCMMIGGQVQKSTSACTGPMAERMLNDLRFSKCFLGGDGFERHAGITCHDLREQAISQLAIRNTAVPYFLLESTKAGSIAMCKVADIDAHAIITDHDMPALEGLGNMIVAKG